jgi:hypothetical protein
MTTDELSRIARLVDKRSIELDGNVFDRRPSSADVELCDLLGYTTTTPEQAASIARIAAAYRGLDPASPHMEREAVSIAGLRKGFPLPRALREKLPYLCAIPATTPQIKLTAVERLERAIDRELAKARADQRPHLIRRWQAELNDLEGNQHDFRAFA